MSRPALQQRGNTLRRALVGVVALVLAAATIAAFSPVFMQGFLTYDDNRYITGNPQVTAGLTAASMRWALTSTEFCNWAPLAWLGHMAAVELFGLAAGGHHALSVLAHAGTALLLFAVLLRTTGRLFASALVAALFALHPLRLESVAWAAELKDPLSGCLAMLTLLAYARYSERPGLRRYLPVVLLFGLGLTVKATLVPLPLVLLALDYWPLGRWATPGARSGRPTTPRILAEKAPLVLLAAGVSLVTYRAQAACGAAGEMWAFPLSSRIGNAAISAVAYLGDAVWPVNLAVFYPHPGLSALPRLTAAAAALLLALTVVALLAVRRQPALLAGWLWYLLLLAPVAGIVRAGLQSRADRYTYLPLIGFAFAVVWVAGRLLRPLRLPPLAVAATALLALGVLAAKTRAGTGVWGDEEALFRRAIAVMERTSLSGGLLGDAPGPSPSYGWPYFALGNVLAQKGRTEEALAAYRMAQSYSPSSVDILSNIATLHARRGELEQSVSYFRAALLVSPQNARARAGLAQALAQLGR